MDLKKELAENQTLLLLVPSIDYNDVVLDMVKQLSGESVCCVTLNKTFESLKETFTKNGVDMESVVFIDAISKTLKECPSQTDGAFFISSPAALTELSVTLSKFLKHGFNYLIFDSITNLMVYERKPSVAKFISTTANKIREGDMKVVFYALNIENQRELIQECEMFVDKTIELGEYKGR